VILTAVVTTGCTAATGAAAHTVEALSGVEEPV